VSCDLKYARNLPKETFQDMGIEAWLLVRCELTKIIVQEYNGTVGDVILNVQC
jgi:hypothetical protein